MCVVCLMTTKAQPVVKVEQGTLRGKIVRFSEQEFINIDREIHAYEGVPYAEPPKRFEATEKKATWSGTWNATYARPACIQSPTTTFGLPVSEDCLYLNIYVPSGVSSRTFVCLFVCFCFFVCLFVCLFIFCLLACLFNWSLLVETHVCHYETRLEILKPG